MPMLTRNLIALFMLLEFAFAQSAALPPGVQYSTEIANNNPDWLGVTITAVAADANGNAYVTGYTRSKGLATTPGVVQPIDNSGVCTEGVSNPTSYPCEEGFVGRFDPQGRLVFLTYLGGSNADFPSSIAIDAAGAIYLAGTTDSADFPRAGSPWAPTISAARTSFLSKLSSDGKTLIYSTLINGFIDGLALPTRRTSRRPRMVRPPILPNSRRTARCWALATFRPRSAGSP
jgi:hypothetical protein